MRVPLHLGLVLALIVLLSAGLGGPIAAQPAEANEPEQAEAGGLVEYDDELFEGDFFKSYAVDVEPGQHLIVNLRSPDFDTYLSMVDPDGEASYNDDWNQTSKHSHLHLISAEGGRYEVRVAGYSIDEVGKYKLSIYTGEQSPDGSLPPIIKSGELVSGDDELPGPEEEENKYVDRYPLDVVAGQHLTIELTSYDFDTYLVLESEDGKQLWENDDFRDSQDVSYLSETIEQAGRYFIIVTSYDPQETGDYDLTIRRGAPPPMAVEPATDRHDGELARGDAVRRGGEYADQYEIEGVAGETVTIDLRSGEFDTYLVFEQLEGAKEDWENDDHNNNPNHSQLSVVLPANGKYAVYASSFDSDETGAYQITITHLPPREGKLIQGELTRDDPARPFGEHVDWIELPTEPGQTIEVRLTAAAFDTFLIVETPSGKQEENDDWEGRGDESRIEFRVTEPGIHRIGVSSFQPRETGSYTLDVLILPAPDTDTLREVQVLAPGRDMPGELMFGDATMDYGELTDRYRFEAVAGQQVTIDLKSQEFDTFLKLIAPSGKEFINDDFDGTAHSQISFIAEETGVYRLYAACYDADVTGNYTLSLDIGIPEEIVPVLPARRVYGIFIGISDYNGSGDLPFCADDATTMHRALRDQFGMRPEDAFILTDQKATVENIEAALQAVVEKASPADTVLFFYSGHGGQVERDGFDALDPDAKDETLAVYDGEITDDRFAQLIEDLDAGTALFMIDACYAGGFAKDLISRPGRMGLFSSEEDVLSMVASRFEAGGYMSMFIREAMGEKRDEADLNRDKILTAHELSHYVSKRYREVVKQAKPLDLLHEGVEVSPETDLSFQKLVSDRGGVSPNQTILSWE
ncbi:MAG: caspase family protein [Planctomycetota bacterium]